MGESGRQLAGDGERRRPAQLILEGQRPLGLPFEPLRHTVESACNVPEFIGAIDRHACSRFAAPDASDALGEGGQRMDDLTLQRERRQSDDHDEQQAEPDKDVDDRFSDLAVRGGGEPDNLQRTLDGAGAAPNR